MTIDDASSVYVGGLSYDCSEDTLRKSFELYGTVIAVKIIKGNDSRVKCYGFVTFTNPRSVTNAISEMHGNTIGGYVVRVNEVTKSGRPVYNRDSNRRDSERNLDWDRGRVQVTDRGRYRERLNEESRDHEQEAENGRACDRSRDQTYDRDQGRERSTDHILDTDRVRNRSKEHILDRDSGRNRGRDRILDRDRGHDHSRDRILDRDRGRERSKDRILDRDRDRNLSKDHILELDRDHDREHNGKEGNENCDQDSGWKHNLDLEKDIEVDKTDDYGNMGEDKGLHFKSQTSSRFSDRRSRDLSSRSSNDYSEQVKEKLEVAIQRRDELEKEVLEIEGKIEEKQQHVSNLQKESQELEASLENWKHLSSKRRKYLTKLQRCYSEIKDFAEKLKSSQLQLESLADISGDEKTIMDGLDLYTLMNIYDVL